MELSGNSRALLWGAHSFMIFFPADSNCFGLSKLPALPPHFRETAGLCLDSLTLRHSWDIFCRQ